MSLLNASYALRASALASGFPLNRKSGFKNAAPPYFHLMILQRQSVAICSLTVRSHTPVCFAKSALFVRIRPSSPVILTSVKSSFNAAFRSLKFLIAVTSTARPPFSLVATCAPSRSFFYCFEGCGGFPPRPRLFHRKKFHFGGDKPRLHKILQYGFTVLPAHGFRVFLFAFFVLVMVERVFLFRFREAKIEKRKNNKLLNKKPKQKKEKS